MRVVVRMLVEARPALPSSSTTYEVGECVDWVRGSVADRGMTMVMVV